MVAKKIHLLQRKDTENQPKEEMHRTKFGRGLNIELPSLCGVMNDINSFWPQCVKICRVISTKEVCLSLLTARIFIGAQSHIVYIAVLQFLVPLGGQAYIFSLHFFQWLDFICIDQSPLINHAFRLSYGQSSQTVKEQNIPGSQKLPSSSQT